ncbi:MAG: 16S rRNA (cytidine(1402)-2'-O)-methyltransferase [bacterium]|nr:16S rRNA (cytidine(1402)-2'-O)-methyltransferase [bacterium]
MATFSVIGTPIGNLEDVTLRALKVLAASDLVLCEDTRMTKKLLSRHCISVPTLSYHAHSKLSRVEEVIQMLKDGKNISLVSDAGTPGISDPGSELLKRIRRELVNEIKSDQINIEAIPGPSALTAALSIAGVSCADFVFLGFLPHKKGRETLFKEIIVSNRTMVFYESPHRIMKTLDSLEEHMLHASAEIQPKCVTVCRELTKVFEEVVQGTSKEVKNYFEEHPDKVRGEFVVIVSEI